MHRRIYPMYLHLDRGAHWRSVSCIYTQTIGNQEAESKVTESLCIGQRVFYSLHPIISPQTPTIQ